MALFDLLAAKSTSSDSLSVAHLYHGSIAARLN
jgi:hypothetical protein